jgi:hypothetical protein
MWLKLRVVKIEYCEKKIPAILKIITKFNTSKKKHLYSIFLQNSFIHLR